MAQPRRRLFLAAQVLFGAAVLLFAARAIARQWRDLPPESFALEPRWGMFALSGLVVLATYAVLIQTWRLTLASWREHDLSFPTAARIWFVSNLGRYIPGKVWQIGALSVMAQRRGVSPIAATGAAILVNLVSVLIGFALVLALGARVLQQPAVALSATVAGLIVLALAPFALPWMVRTLRAVTGREVPLPSLPTRAVWIAAIGTGAAWLLYGVAFQLLVVATLGRAAGIWTEYVAVFAGSYLIGYLVLIVPSGLVVRESAMVYALTALGLATATEALVLAFVSRLWLTVLEVIPGALFLLRPERGPHFPDSPADASSG